VTGTGSIHKHRSTRRQVLHYLSWSISLLSYIPAPDQAHRIVRLRINDGKIEDVADLSKVGRLVAGTFGEWFGLARDDSPLLARDISSQEIYARGVQLP
jgi:hypothetical protein